MATSVKRLKKHIFLHPSDKHRKATALKTTLLRDRKKYSDKLDGALLDVSEIKLLGNRHLIVDGYLSMEVVAKFHVFSPKPGMELEGTVNKCSKSHLGCLVMDMFNASLYVPRMSSMSPGIGDICKFEVTEVVVEGEILFVRGQLKSFKPGPTSGQQDENSQKKSDLSEQDDAPSTVKDVDIDDELL